MNTNEMLVIYTQAISFASGISVFRPYLPMVKAMAPNAPIGAACMIRPITPNIRWAILSQPAISVLPCPSAASARPTRIASSSTCRISPSAKAPDEGVRDDVHAEIHACSGAVPARRTAAIALASSLPASTFMPAPGWITLTTTSPISSAIDGHHFEVQQRLQSDPAQFAHIADAGDAHHHRKEDDRTDHHADQLDEAVAQRLHLAGRLGENTPSTTPRRMPTITRKYSVR